MDLYSDMGGEPFFTTLVHHFYQGVANDLVLRPMYPEADLEPAERRLRLFLMQYWGGPSTYQEERGHPRLRMRHQPFAIDDDGRARWIAHMDKALALTEEKYPLPEHLRNELWAYLQSAAQAMVNTWPEHTELS